MTFADRLRRAQIKPQSLLCIGLDPDVRKLPRDIRTARDPIFEFNRHIIQATEDLVCAYKFNLAFYDSLGRQGLRSLERTLAIIPPGIITIGDAKRGDIGNTAEMYARQMFEQLGFSATTVSPYMGTDSVEPFLRDTRRGAFILALTSNPGARDFQYLRVNGRPLYECVVERARSWNVRGNCGLVVGATRPMHLRRIRRLVPHMPLLIPGIGAQGGDVQLAVRYGCDATGLMAVINASRSIIYASRGRNFVEAVRAAAGALRDEVNRYRAALF